MDFQVVVRERLGDSSDVPTGQPGTQIGRLNLGNRSKVMRSKMPGFYITGGKGFHITFANYYTVSVQFGPGSYSDNYDRYIGREDEESGKDGSSTAECAVWAEDGELIEYEGWGNTVSNRSSPAEVLALLNWAASQPIKEGQHE